ncbi:MAG: hypothetical protein EA351_09625 [Gemmatimonadales bacterium]|nr:MAG: hypothetical protein EA351_09625 [Gemmatimonadales bacterium]
MTREELGAHVAHMVWESLTDLLLSDESSRLFSDLGVSTEDGVPSDSATKELLIYLMWAHVRSIRQAFHPRANGDPVNGVLGALHRAIYEDLEKRGITAAELPIFEQRVAARYFDYHHALEESPEVLGRTAARHLGRSDEPTPESARILASWAQEIFQPLQDFLEELEIIPPESPRPK